MSGFCFLLWFSCIFCGGESTIKVHFWFGDNTQPPPGPEREGGEDGKEGG